MMEPINEGKLKELLDSLGSAERDKKITIYSRPVATILRYLDLTKEQFSRAGAAAETMERVVQKEHKALWKLFKQHGIPTTVKLEKSYWSGIGVIDDKAWAQAVEETNTKKGRLITIYHPRISAVMRYLDMTTPRFSKSKEAAKLLEAAVKRKAPELWQRVKPKQDNSS